MRLTAALPLLLCGCVVRTGLCETGEDCAAEQVCNQATHRCEDAVPDLGDLDLSVPDLAPLEEDLAPPPDLTPVPPDLSGDLLGTGLLEVQRTGDGAGLVRSAPAGIACGVSCTAVFPDGTQVRLSIEGLDQDSFFAGWSGACSGEGTCDVTVRGTVRVGASIKKRSFQPTASGITNNLRAVFGLPPPAAGAVFAAGEGGKVLRFGGTGWVNLNNPRSFPIYGLWTHAANSLWALGGGPPLRWNGTSWAASPGAFIDPFYSVFGLTANDVWAVGSNGGAIHYDGTLWEGEPTANFKDHQALFGATASDVWLVGHDGEIQRWNGSVWKIVASPTMANLYALWGAGRSSVWAVGQSGTILRWDGTRWSAETSPTTESLRGVFGYDDGMGQPREMWAVGEKGVALRWRAGRWSLVPTGSTVTLYGAWGEGSGQLWAVGETGTILRYDAHR